jgi:hypothetical protein
MTGTPQLISIPLADHTGVSLARMERTFHVELSCPAVNCLTYFTDIAWTLD